MVTAMTVNTLFAVLFAAAAMVRKHIQLPLWAKTLASPYKFISVTWYGLRLHQLRLNRPVQMHPVAVPVPRTLRSAPLRPTFHRLRIQLTKVQLRLQPTKAQLQFPAQPTKAQLQFRAQPTKAQLQFPVQPTEVHFPHQLTKFQAIYWPNRRRQFMSSCLAAYAAWFKSNAQIKSVET